MLSSPRTKTSASLCTGQVEYQPVETWEGALYVHKTNIYKFSLRSLLSHDVCCMRIVSGKRLDIVEYLLGQHAPIDEPDEVTQWNRRSNVRYRHIIANALDADTAIPCFLSLVWMDPSPYCR